VPQEIITENPIIIYFRRGSHIKHSKQVNLGNKIGKVSEKLKPMNDFLFYPRISKITYNFHVTIPLNYIE
jgi:hypothetical protein